MEIKEVKRTIGFYMRDTQEQALVKAFIKSIRNSEEIKQEFIKMFTPQED